MIMTMLNASLLSMIRVPGGRGEVSALQTAALGPSRLIVLMVIGVIVFACSLVALRRAEILGAGSRFVLALCTAALSVIGLWRMLGQHYGVPVTPAQAESQADGVFNGILVPYIALALAMLGVLLILFFRSCLRVFKNVWSSLKPRSALSKTTDRAPSKAPACNRIGDRLSGRNRNAEKFESGGPWI